MVEDVSETFLINRFVGELKDEIWLELKIQNLQSLSTTIGLARLIEEKCNLCNQPSQIQSITQSLLGLLPINHTPPIIRCLTPIEVKDYKDWALYYYCHRKYAPGHKCQNPQFFVIEGKLICIEDKNTFNQCKKFEPC